MSENAVQRAVEFVRASWSTLLQVDLPDEGANFFVLGGDSMLGAMFTVALSESTGTDFSIGDLYECPTLAEFAVLISVRTNQGFES